MLLDSSRLGGHQPDAPALPALEAEISHGNVPTLLAAQLPLESLDFQGFQALIAAPELTAPTYSVKDAGAGSRAKGKPRRARRRSRKQGKRGPKGSKCLTWDEVKQVNQFAHLANKEHLRLGMFLTIRAPIGVSDAEAKKHIRRAVDYLGRIIGRFGYPHIGVTVYEKSPYLHAHHLFHAPIRLTSRIMEWSQGKGDDRHARKADSSAVTYMTKQRRWLGPEFEAKLASGRGRRQLWEKGVYISGPRLTFTRDAKELTAGHARPQIRNGQEVSWRGPGDAQRGRNNLRCLTSQDARHSPQPGI